MKSKQLLLTLLLTLFSVALFAQKVHVKAQNESLSTVIKRLGAEVSFDNRLLSIYKVSVNKSFTSPYEAIVFLIEGKPLQAKKIAGVIVITEKKKLMKPKPPEERMKPIPRKIAEMPPISLSLSLNEILITARNHTPTLSGEDADGSNHFNSITASAMPGCSDNLVFNVLRMMPGIRAAGEPSDELYVWGSSPGESRVTFDGIPLFAMQSYNSNMSYINPYMFNEVKYKRGILSAAEDGQTGAKVDVVSDMLQINKPTLKALVSTMSANLFGALPVGGNCVLSVAYRHTLEDWFKKTVFDPYRHNNTAEHHSEGSDKNTTKTETDDLAGDSLKENKKASTIVPKFKFQDLNVNVTGKNDQGLFYKVALYAAKDYLDYENDDSITVNGDQTSYQGGISVVTSKTWSNNHKSEVSAFFSGLRSEQNGNNNKLNYSMIERVTQYNARLQQIGIGKWHHLTVGGEFSAYRIKGSAANKTAFLSSAYASEKESIGRWDVEMGLRADLTGSEINFQPRAMLRFHFLNYFTLSGAWGIYNQYLVKNPFAITDGRYQFAWDINKTLKSYNTVGGIAFNKDGLNISIEAYYKRIHNSAWVVNNLLGSYNFNLWGTDLSAKFNWNHGLVFASWSLANDERQTSGYSNEMKIGGILHFYPFTVSSNYVFSKGFNSFLLPLSTKENHEVERSFNAKAVYSRMDISASYEKRFAHWGFTTGLSLINVFNTDNKKCVSSWIPRNSASSYYSQAAKFTPILFFELKI